MCKEECIHFSMLPRSTPSPTPTPPSQTSSTRLLVFISDKGDFMGRIWGYPDMGLGEPFISVFLHTKPKLEY